MRCDPTRTRAPGRPSSPWRRRRRAATTRSACRGTLWPTVSTRSTSSCHARPRAPTVVGGPRHVDEFDFAAKADFPFPTPPTKKGLQVQDVADAQELGTGHAAINVAFDQLMYERPEGTADAVPFESGGRTYWFRGAYLDALDRQIRPLSDDGVLVNLILILYDTQRPNSAIEHLLHPDAARGQGSVYAFNTKTEDGIA